MAFNSREERKLVYIKTASNEIGPGAYIDQMNYEKKNGYAPFCATSLRDFSLVSPTSSLVGPGSYLNPDNNSPTKNIKPSPIFANNIERFKEQESLNIPGPGYYEYNPKQTDIKKPRIFKFNNNSSKLLKTASPPSIPVKANRAGYDLTPNGELILNQTVEKGGDSLGPGSYNPINIKETLGNKGTM